MNHKLSGEYSARRERHLKAQRARRSEAYQKCSALEALDKQYREAQVRRGLALAKGDEAAAAQAEGDAAAALSRQKALLVSVGLPENWLDLTFDCSACQDSGTLPDGSACACLKQAIMALNTRESNLTRFREERFDAWELCRVPVENGQRAASEKLYHLCLDYAENFPHTERSNLLLIGGTGLGKSFALHCIGGRVLERGFSVRKLTAHQFYQMIVEEILGKRDYSALHALEAVDLLILDDLGAEPQVSELSESTLYTLLDERTMSGRHTLFASNLSENGLADRYGERTVSRLLNPNVTRALHLRGKDLRLQRCQPQKT